MEQTKQKKRNPNAKTIKVHEFLERQLELCGKTQREIAIECGYKNPNIITMFKQAKTKLPLDKVGPMATALGVDPIHLLKITMLDYHPEMWAVIEGIMGRMVTENQYQIIEAMRSMLPDESADPRISDQQQMGKLREFANSLRV